MDVGLVVSELLNVEWVSRCCFGKVGFVGTVLGVVEVHTQGRSPLGMALTKSSPE